MRRLALLTLPAVAALPAAVASQDAEISPAATMQPVSQPRPGQYRSVFELLTFEVPGVTEEQARQLRDVFAEEMESGNDFCLKGSRDDEAATRRVLEQFAEGQCRFDSFERTGAAVSAAMYCTRGRGVASQMTIDGRVWGENADLNMTLNQAFEGTGAVLIGIRVQSTRIGDC